MCVDSGRRVCLSRAAHYDMRRNAERHEPEPSCQLAATVKLAGVANRGDQGHPAGLAAPNRELIAKAEAIALPRRVVQDW